MYRNQNYRINLYRDLRAPKIFAPPSIPTIILLSVRGLRFVFTNLVHLEIEIALDQFSIHYPLTFKNQTKKNGQKSARKNKNDIPKLVRFRSSTYIGKFLEHFFALLTYYCNPSENSFLPRWFPPKRIYQLSKSLYLYIHENNK